MQSKGKSHLKVNSEAQVGAIIGLTYHFCTKQPNPRKFWQRHYIQPRKVATFRYMTTMVWYQDLILWISHRGKF